MYTIEFNSGNPSQNVRFSSYAETLNYREYGAKPENYLSVTDFSDYLKEKTAEAQSQQRLNFSM